MVMEKYEAIEKEMCRELEIIDEKLKNGGEMSENDLKRIDLLTHAMKSLATYKAMKESIEYEGDMSGRRGRAANGRYVSRDSGPMSYDDGYSERYYPMPPYMNGYGVRGRNW